MDAWVGHVTVSVYPEIGDGLVVGCGRAFYSVVANQLARCRAAGRASRWMRGVFTFSLGCHVRCVL